MFESIKIANYLKILIFFFHCIRIYSINDIDIVNHENTYNEL